MQILSFPKQAEKLSPCQINYYRTSNFRVLFFSQIETEESCNTFFFNLKIYELVVVATAAKSMSAPNGLKSAIIFCSPVSLLEYRIPLLLAIA